MFHKSSIDSLLELADSRGKLLHGKWESGSNICVIFIPSSLPLTYFTYEYRMSQALPFLVSAIVHIRAVDYLENLGRVVKL